MSITDELRKWARDNLTQSAALCITAIADRIDAAVDGMVELPKDADGEPIHIGDEVEEIDCDGGHRVFELRLCESGWWVTAGGICRRPYKYRHRHAPTVEDVLTEFGIDWEHESDCEDRAALLKEYASKLRLVEGEDA